MRTALRLLSIAAEAAFVVDAGCFALTALSAGFPSKPTEPTIPYVITLSLAFVFFVGLATWLSARRLRAFYSRREAHALTIAIGIFLPLSMAVSLPLALFVGDVHVPLAENRYGLLVLYPLCVGIITALFTFAACLLVSWLTRRVEKVEQYDTPQS